MSVLRAPRSTDERAMSVCEGAMNMHGHAVSVRGRAVSVQRHMQFELKLFSFH